MSTETGADRPAISLDGVAISLAGVKVSYGPTAVLNGVSATLRTGEWLGLIGPNGAGKTTLLKAVAGLVACEGEILIAGSDSRRMRRRDRARAIAYLPQHPSFPPDMPVIDYVLLGRTPHIAYFGSETGRDQAICREVLERLDLAAMAERALRTLSGGELQRVTLARALAQQAPVLLLDEPITALDVSRQLDALELIDELRRELSLAVIAAMHDLTLAGRFADELLLLDRGSVASVGSPTEVLTTGAVERYYGRDVEVLRTSEGELVVVPRRRRPMLVTVSEPPTTA